MKTLTTQQLEVAKHVALGRSNAEIARVMGLTERTVKNYLTVIFDKVGVRNRLQLGLQMQRTM